MRALQGRSGSAHCPRSDKESEPCYRILPEKGVPDTVGEKILVDKTCKYAA